LIGESKNTLTYTYLYKNAWKVFGITKPKEDDSYNDWMIAPVYTITK
jgi:hypothetical protein